MPDIEIIKLKIRRGTDDQRKSVILEQGELGYTTDTKRVWVGDGVLSGGNVIGNIAHTPLDVVNKTGITNAVKGDIVSEKGLLYQLSGTDYSQTSAWGFIGTRLDEDVLTYDNDNRVIVKSLSGTFAPQSGLVDNGTGIEINVDNSTLGILSNYLTVLSINQNHISSNSFGDGIIGGSGSSIEIGADPNQFEFINGYLTLSKIKVASLDPDIIGAGLQINGDEIEAVLQDVDDSTISKTDGTISSKIIGGGGSTKFSDITYDIYGRVTGYDSTIIYALSVDPTITGYADATLQEEKYFRGYYGDPVGGAQTLVYAISAGETTNEILTLSSAGFIVLNTGTELPGERLAIPAFLF